MFGLFKILLRVLVGVQGVVIGAISSQMLKAAQDGKDAAKVTVNVKPSQLLFGVASSLLLAPLFPSKLLGALFSGIGTGFATDIAYGDISDEELLKRLQGK